MSDVTIWNGQWMFALGAIFIGQPIILGLICIALGLSGTVDPFIFTSLEYGLALEGAILAITSIPSVIIISLFIKMPIKFVIREDSIESHMPGALFFKSSEYRDTFPREVTSKIVVKEVITTNDEGGKSTSYTADFLREDGSTFGKLSGISSTGIVDEIAETMGVEIHRSFGSDSNVWD